MSNFIIGSSKFLITNYKISEDTLKMRELEIFLDSELMKYAFDFEVRPNNSIYYKKIVPIDSKKCEVKERELKFTNGKLQLKYDNRNITNLIRNIDKFNVNKRGDLIFLNITTKYNKLTKVLPQKSYSI